MIEITVTGWRTVPGNHVRHGQKLHGLSNGCLLAACFGRHGVHTLLPCAIHGQEVRWASQLPDRHPLGSIHPMSPTRAAGFLKPGPIFPASINTSFNSERFDQVQAQQFFDKGADIGSATLPLNVIISRNMVDQFIQ